MQELSEQGWRRVIGELCALDCLGTDAWLKTFRGREIILCAPHARTLERGKQGGTYHGAPLPPESRATEWPWMPVRVIDPAVFASAV